MSLSDDIQKMVEVENLYWEIRRTGGDLYLACIHDGSPTGHWGFHRNASTPDEALKKSFEAFKEKQ